MTSVSSMAALPTSTLASSRCTILSSSFLGHSGDVVAANGRTSPLSNTAILPPNGNRAAEQFAVRARIGATKGNQKEPQGGGTQRVRVGTGTVKGGIDTRKGETGTIQIKLGRPARELPRDERLVFVAGATGKVGSRIVRELVRLGFKVRAGVRDIKKAEKLLSDLPEPPRTGFFSILPIPRAKPVTFVECDLEDPSIIEEAIGAASRVVCSIGASEKEVFDVTAPYRIDKVATENLVDAAKDVGVLQFVHVSSIGTEKIGFPATLLNLFWGVLIWKAQAERKLKNSGLAFAIVRPGGMERPTDAYKETHNLRLSPGGSLTGGQVSALQVAELIGTIISNPDISENKVMEVVAETVFPLTPTEEMLQALPVVGLTQAQRQELQRQKDEEEARKLEEARLAEERRIQEAKEAEERRIAAERAKEMRARLSEELIVAKERQKEALEEAETIGAAKAGLERKRAEIKAKAEAAALAAKEAQALEVAVVKAAKEGKILSAQVKEKIISDVRAKAAAGLSVAEEQAPPAFQLPRFGVFGGRAAAKEEVKAEAKVSPPPKASAAASPAQAVKAPVAAKVAGKPAAAPKPAKPPSPPPTVPSPDLSDSEIRKAAESLLSEEDLLVAARAAAAARVRAKLGGQVAKKANTGAAGEGSDSVKKEKAEAEAKTKAEVDAKAKVEAEAKAKAEAEAKAKAETEAKAKAEADKEKVLAVTEAEGKVEVLAATKEPESANGGVTVSTTASTDLPPSPTPLSPYTS